VAGEAHGRGTFSFANGTCYEGTCGVPFGRHHSESETDPGTGSRSGDIVMGYFEGQGKFTFANGAVYEGTFKARTTIFIYICIYI
jgi:hypothetical protein